MKLWAIRAAVEDDAAAMVAYLRRYVSIGNEPDSRHDSARLSDHVKRTQ